MECGARRSSAVKSRGGWAGTLEFAVDPRDPAVAWLAAAKQHGSIDVIGPLGTPFSYPTKLTNCLLVSEGLGSASMHFLAQDLRTNGKRVDMVVGATTQDEIFKIIDGKRLSAAITIVTADGSAGERGVIADVLAGAVDANRLKGQFSYAPAISYYAMNANQNGGIEMPMNENVVST